MELKGFGPLFIFEVGVIAFGAFLDNMFPEISAWIWLAISIMAFLGVFFWPEKEGGTFIASRPSKVLFLIAIALLLPLLFLLASEWASKSEVKDKLGYAGFHIEPEPPPPWCPVSEIGLGFRVKNTSDFSIEFKVQSLYTELEGELRPPNIPYKNDTIRVAPTMTGKFWDNGIHLGSIPKTKRKIKGALQAHLKYGRPGNLNQDLKFKQEVDVYFNDKGCVAYVRPRDRK